MFTMTSLDDVKQKITALMKDLPKIYVKAQTDALAGSFVKLPEMLILPQTS